MGARRAPVVVVILAVVVLAPGSSVLAGGSWISPDRRIYVPGDPAVLDGSFSLSGSLEGRLSDGPYVAYLLEEGVWIERDRIPEGAVRLGALELDRSGGYHNVRARISFRVPEVPTGRYHVGYCNDPCTVNGIGDLMGGLGFVIAPTRAEGLAFVRTDQLAAKLENARASLSEARAVRDGLEHELDSARARIEVLEAERSSRDVPLVTPRIERVVESSVTWWIAGLAAMLGIAVGAALARRRNRARIVIPDTVPDDLEQRVGR